MEMCVTTKYTYGKKQTKSTKAGVLEGVVASVKAALSFYLFLIFIYLFLVVLNNYQWSFILYFEWRHQAYR